MLENVFLFEQQVVHLVCEIVADFPYLVVEVNVAVVESVKTSAETEDQVHVGQRALKNACFSL